MLNFRFEAGLNSAPVLMGPVLFAGDLPGAGMVLLAEDQTLGFHLQEGWKTLHGSMHEHEREFHTHGYNE